MKHSAIAMFVFVACGSSRAQDSFAAHRDATDPNVINSYLILGKKLNHVPGAPSRCGYYVGLLAVRAWQKAHPDSGPADLIATSAADIWQSLPLETKR